MVYSRGARGYLADRYIGQRRAVGSAACVMIATSDAVEGDGGQSDPTKHLLDGARFIISAGS